MILRALTESQVPLTASGLVGLLAEGIPVRQHAVTRYAAALANHERNGRAVRTGHTPGGYQQAPAWIWDVTEAGRAWLAAYDAAPARLAQAQARAARRAELAARDAAGRAAKLRQVQAAYKEPPPRDAWPRVAREMRDEACTYAEIGSVLGISRQAAHALLRSGGDA